MTIADHHQETDNLEKWSRAGGLEGRLLGRFRERIVREVVRLAPANVLDVGCGEGVVIGWLAEALPGARITGVDARRDALEELRRRLGDDPRVRAVEGDVYRLPFGEREFDLVISTEVVEHLDDPVAALREMARVCGASLLVTVPHEPFFRLGNLARGRYLARGGSTPGHQSTWGRAGFSRLVRRETGPVRWLSLFPWQATISTPPPPGDA